MSTNTNMSATTNRQWADTLDALQPFLRTPAPHRVSITLANPVARSVVRVDGRRVYCVQEMTIRCNAGATLVDVVCAVWLKALRGDLPCELGVIYPGHVDGILAQVRFVLEPR